VQSEVETLLGFGNDYTSSEIFFTPRAKRVLENAWKKAQKYNYSTILSQHILWAICQEENSLALKVLSNLNINIKDIEQGILDKIEQQN
jgi:ATP-dependent Clp protease ATP-binding subunit ClpC